MTGIPSYHKAFDLPVAGVLHTALAESKTPLAAASGSSQPAAAPPTAPAGLRKSPFIC